MGLTDPLGPDVEPGEQTTRHVPWPTLPECAVRHCIRPPYDPDGRCKRHADEHRYAKMRELERRCHAGTSVRCVANHEWLYGVACSAVRLVPRDMPTRGRWPSVLVRIHGHLEAVEWPAIDVELAPAEGMAA